jgi:hypothetical protein
MPALMDTLDYERFEYKHFDEQPLSLEEAIKKAQALKAGDESSVFRVIPLDDELTGFCVEKVDKSELYTSLLSRVTKLWSKLYTRSWNKVR